jgi:NADH:ubiquinone oxidoreductase subunit C
MHDEESIKLELANLSLTPAEAIRIARPRRMFAEVSYENFRKLLVHARDKAGFTVLCTITGLDEGENFSFMYHMARPSGIMLTIKTFAPKSEPKIKTVTDLFPGSAIYERELTDLFGIVVEGTPPGKRYPLPDNWPEGQYPLRKDWTTDMLRKGDGK